jgi:hypothetical protein
MVMVMMMMMMMMMMIVLVDGKFAYEYPNKRIVSDERRKSGKISPY